MARIILITGVSQGLGKAMMEGFIEAGHQVWGCARSEGAIATFRSIYGSPHQFGVVDVADATQVEAWAEQLLPSGTPDLVINNAAVINQPATLWEVPVEEFDSLIDVNIKGTVNVIRAFVPAMIRARQGVIVNFSSGWGRSTSPEVAPYCTSKWAIEGMTRALAQELPPSLGAIALNPGVIHTEMLETCFGNSASSYTPIPAWKKQAVPFLLGLTAGNNGASLTIPG